MVTVAAAGVNATEETGAAKPVAVAVRTGALVTATVASPPRRLRLAREPWVLATTERVSFTAEMLGSDVVPVTDVTPVVRMGRPSETLAPAVWVNALEMGVPAATHAVALAQFTVSVKLSKPVDRIPGIVAATREPLMVWLGGAVSVLLTVRPMGPTWTPRFAEVAVDGAGAGGLALSADALECARSTAAKVKPASVLETVRMSPDAVAVYVAGSGAACAGPPTATRIGAAAMSPATTAAKERVSFGRLQRGVPKEGMTGPQRRLARTSSVQRRHGTSAANPFRPTVWRRPGDPFFGVGGVQPYDGDEAI
jgi:hypothetical protein